MLRKLLNLLKLKPLQTATYVVIYRAHGHHFYLGTYVEASSSYDAARAFDTTPGNEIYVRIGDPHALS